MSLDTYANLQVEIADWLDRTDLTTRIVTFISLAEAAMARELAKLGVRRMVGRATLAITTDTVDVPTDYAGAKSLRIDGSTELTWVSPEQMANFKAYNAQAGTPSNYSVIGGEIEMYPSPSSACDGLLVYYQKPPALSDSNTSNWVLANHPDLYLWGACAQGARFMNDEAQLATFTGLYRNALAEIEASNQTESIGGRIAPQSALGAGFSP